MINEKTWARNRVQRHAGLHFVYKKSENDKEQTEYKEKIRYILCLKIFVEAIYRIIHRVGIIKIVPRLGSSTFFGAQKILFEKNKEVN